MSIKIYSITPKSPHTSHSWTALIVHFHILLKLAHRTLFFRICTLKFGMDKHWCSSPTDDLNKNQEIVNNISIIHKKFSSSKSQIHKITKVVSSYIQHLKAPELDWRSGVCTSMQQIMRHNSKKRSGYVQSSLFFFYNLDRKSVV